MKGILPLLLAFTILAQTFVNVGIGVYYHLNKEYISKKLCENRNNPKIHCDGHCYLSKQLKKAEEGESKTQSQLLKEKEEIVANFFSETTVTFNDNFSLIGFFPRSQNTLISAPVIDIIKPPVIIA